MRSRDESHPLFLHLGADYMENFSPGLKKKNAITWEISARAETECESGNRCFLYLLLYTKVLRVAFMNFQHGLKFLVDYMGNFSPINRAENLISGSSNRAEIFSVM